MDFGLLRLGDEMLVVIVAVAAGPACSSWIDIATLQPLGFPNVRPKQANGVWRDLPLGLQPIHILLLCVTADMICRVKGYWISGGVVYSR